MRIAWDKLDGRDDRTRMRWEWAKYDDDLDVLKRFYRSVKGSPSAPKPKPSSGFSGGGRLDYLGKRQFVVVKLNYSKNQKSHKVMLGQYLSQARKENVEKKPEVFSADREGEEACKAYKERMVPLHFKFIISPESSKVPLQGFTRAYMERMEFELGTKFDWVAAVHTDTPHPHVHILINGADRDGKPLRRPFPKDFVRTRSCKLASDIVTSIVGERSAEDIAAARERALVSSRWTSFDESIRSLARDGMIVPSSEHLERRLAHLAKISLATYDNGVYKLERNWDTTLQFTGRYNSFMKARDELKWNVGHELKLFQGGRIRGIVRKVYTLDEEGENNNAVVVENRNEAFFVPLFNRPSKNLAGKKCTIEAVSSSKGRLAPRIVEEGTAPKERDGDKKNLR